MAISIPDIVYKQAGKTAAYRGIPRRKLLVIAREEFIAGNKTKRIANKLNEAYDKIEQTEREPIAKYALKACGN